MRSTLVSLLLSLTACTADSDGASWASFTLTLPALARAATPTHEELLAAR